MSKELWMEIHDYSPPDPGEDSISPDGAVNPPSTTDTTQPKPTDEVTRNLNLNGWRTRNMQKNRQTIISLRVRKNNKEI
jgi:hypothetical protein